MPGCSVGVHQLACGSDLRAGCMQGKRHAGRHIRQVTVVGPTIALQVLNKYVGQSEENIRNLFAEADEEYKAKVRPSYAKLS